jgi:hypothetical protein
MPDVNPALGENVAHFAAQNLVGDQSLAIKKEYSLFAVIDHKGSRSRHITPHQVDICYELLGSWAGASTAASLRAR